MLSRVAGSPRIPCACFEMAKSASHAVASSCTSAQASRHPLHEWKASRSSSRSRSRLLSFRRDTTAGTACRAWGGHGLYLATFPQIPPGLVKRQQGCRNHATSLREHETWTLPSRLGPRTLPLHSSVEGQQKLQGSTLLPFHKSHLG